MAIPEHGPYRGELLRIGPQDSGHHPWVTNGWCWPRFLGEFIIAGFSRCSSPKMVSFRFGGFYQKRNFQVGKSAWKYMSDWKKNRLQMESFHGSTWVNKIWVSTKVSPQWPGTDGSVTIFSYLDGRAVFFVASLPAGCGAGSCRCQSPHSWQVKTWTSLCHFPGFLVACQKKNIANTWKPQTTSFKMDGNGETPHF